MDLTVAICTFNGASRLPATLEALRQQKELAAIEWELLLIDHHSNDQTCALFEQFQKANPEIHSRMLHETSPGARFSACRAYREAAAPWICRVDDDNLLAPDYLRKGFDFATRASRQIGAFGGRSIAKFEGNEPSHLEAFSLGLAIGDCGDVERQLLKLERVFTAGLFVRTEAIRSVLAETWLMNGRSPTCPFGGEDTEMYVKMTRRGWQYWYVPGLSFLHVMPAHRVELKSLLRQRALQGGESLFMALGYSDPKQPLLVIALWQYLIEGWAKFLARCLLFCLTPGRRRWRQLSELALRWGFIRYFYYGLMNFGQRRHEVALTRDASHLMSEAR